MGAFCSSSVEPADTLSKAIDKQLAMDEKKTKDRKRLLLLGTGECGKSTILKQVRILHDDQWDKVDLEFEKRRILCNVLEGAAQLYNGAVQDQVMLGLEAENAGLLIKDILANKREMAKLNWEIARALKALWADNGIRGVYERRNSLQIPDSISFYMDSIDRICDPTYKPSNDDFLHLRIPTTGVVEFGLTIKDLHFVFIDVGGQRSERKKWLVAFNEVTSVLFISAVSEYDQVLNEEKTQNRLRESLNLYRDTMHQYFPKTPTILFLNKTDLFEEKIPKKPMTEFKEYKGPSNVEACLTYIELKFRSYSVEGNPPYVHRTCATRTDQVQLVIGSVIDSIIQENLTKMGIQ